MARGGGLLMVTMRGGRRKGHCSGTVASDEDEEIAASRGATEGETGDAMARGGKGRQGEENDDEGSERGCLPAMGLIWQVVALVTGKSACKRRP